MIDDFIFILFKRTLVNTKTSSTTSESLAVQDRQQTDEAKAEKLQRDIVNFCRRV